MSDGRGRKTPQRGDECCPATRWAMGVVGLASTAAIIMALLRSPVFGLVGMAAVFVAMVALFIFSRVVKFASRATRPLAIIFMWFVGMIAMATIRCVFLDFADRSPVLLNHGSSSIWSASATRPDRSPRGVRSFHGGRSPDRIARSRSNAGRGTRTRRYGVEDHGGARV